MPLAAPLGPLAIIVSLVGGYLLGSIPFGVIATRWAGLGDVRSIGSGNIGATNVLRTGRRDLALATLIGDAGKGVAAVLVFGALFGAAAAAIAGGAAFLGHLFSVWLKFKGGKGLAVFLGILLAIAWPAGLLACATWALIAAIFRFSSLASLAAAALAPLWIFLFGGGLAPAFWLCLFMTLLIFLRHKENIQRLASGEEPRIGRSRANPWPANR
ncbi:MAG: glycerol-3-phosphate 1-O-acyltransferase PlsY [Caulobacteraceae bacterium]